jgi:hypothetical protein
VLGLQRIRGADHRQHHEQHQRNADEEQGEFKEIFEQQKRRDEQHDGVDDEPRLQRQWQIAHGNVPGADEIGARATLQPHAPPSFI